MDTQLTFAVTAFSIHNTASLLVDDEGYGSNRVTSGLLTPNVGAPSTLLVGPRLASLKDWARFIVPSKNISCRVKVELLFSDRNRIADGCPLRR